MASTFALRYGRFGAVDSCGAEDLHNAIHKLDMVFDNEMDWVEFYQCVEDEFGRWSENLLARYEFVYDIADDPNAYVLLFIGDELQSIAIYS